METVAVGRRNCRLSQEATQAVSLHTASSSGCGLSFTELQKYLGPIWAQYCEAITTCRSDHKISVETNRQLSAEPAWMWRSHYGWQINKP